MGQQTDQEGSMEQSNLLDRALDLIVADRSPRFIALLLDSRECAMLSVAQIMRGSRNDRLSDAMQHELTARIRAQIEEPGVA
jgi:hypothetical protein